MRTLRRGDRARFRSPESDPLPGGMAGGLRLLASCRLAYWPQRPSLRRLRLTKLLCQRVRHDEVGSRQANQTVTARAQRAGTSDKAAHENGFQHDTTQHSILYTPSCRTSRHTRYMLIKQNITSSVHLWRKRGGGIYHSTQVIRLTETWLALHFLNTRLLKQRK